MPLFKKKPVVIEAVQLNYQNWNAICDFVGKDVINERTPGYNIPLEEVSDTCGESGDGPGFLAFAVTTTHGERAIVRHGDWVIPDSKPGTFYPCKPDVFKKTYGHIITPTAEEVQNYERVWNDFWEEICTNPDGSVNLDQVKRELSDYKGMMDEVTIAYDTLTMGNISKPNTMASAVISEVERIHQRDLDELEKELTGEDDEQG